MNRTPASISRLKSSLKRSGRCIYRFAVVIPGLCASVSYAQSAADTFPTRTVTIITGLAAGGSTDLETRRYAQKLSANTGKSFIVENRPGAGGTIGFAFVARATPDGHTVLVSSPSFPIAPLMYKDLPYDTEKGFAPITVMSKRSSVLMAHPSLPVRTVQEYVAYAKANPGAVNFGTSGIGGITHLSAQWFHDEANVKATLVHFKSGGPLLNDVLSGRVHMGMFNLASVIAHVKAGKLRMLGITGVERNKMVPDIPTIAEQGLPNYDYTFWVGFSTTAGTPPAIVNKLNEELVKVARSPENVALLAKDDNQAIGSTPEAFQRLLSTEIVRWRKVVQQSNITME